MIDEKDLVRAIELRQRIAKRNNQWFVDLPHEMVSNILALLKEQQQYIWELQDQVEYLTDKLKEQEAVVRCKDCVFGKREKNDSTGMTWIYCGHHRENRPEDWFCASGSRI
jgi:uncharacterized coiled-coil protein SlyX